MGRITNLQNDIGELQRALQERNQTIASLNKQLSDEKQRSADLTAKLKLAESTAKAA